MPKSSPSTARPSARLSGPADVIDAVPYLLGYHPHDSLVLLGLRRQAVAVAARLDLVDAVPALLHDTAAALCRGGVEEVIAVVFADCVPEPLERELPLSDLVPDVGEALAAVECDLTDALLVADGRYWSYRCRGDGCCPADGTPLVRGTSAFAAESTFAGRVVLPDRADLARLIAPAPDRELLAGALDAADRMSVAEVLDRGIDTWRRRTKRALFAAARRHGTADGSAGLDDDTLARFGSALRDIKLRDAVWLAIDNRRLDGRALWAELGRRLPSPYDAPPLFLFGWASWRAGDGTIASFAADRAMAADPDYTAAPLLRAALDRAMDPRRMPRLRMPKPA
ncbi:MAG: DUF4192 domain-containing protein [Jatrophihabitans sp.]|uniref:DUF4192 domain-containing protein n=1 Tax=Jatrophihabitans sp. TaxID=1932789 RepID=UPI003F8035E5